MRVRLSDGTREVEVEADTGPKDDTARSLALLADTARRLYETVAPPTAPDRPTPFGYGRDLDGISLDATTERAEPYDDGRGDEYDDDEGRQ
ncbi:hypothetical protein ACF1BE_19830 [Streptomyces sp. NPDC014991]|uniref:hypothetical protein n=1 Tax=Streptomyces sp. NPDC014991 TaxID=3364935 RepID=UPI0036F81A60